MKTTESFDYIRKVYSLLPLTGVETEYSGEIIRRGDSIRCRDGTHMQIDKLLPITTPKVTVKSLLRLHPGQWKRFACSIVTDGGFVTGDFIYNIHY